VENISTTIKEYKEERGLLVRTQSLCDHPHCHLLHSKAPSHFLYSSKTCYTSNYCTNFPSVFCNSPGNTYLTIFNTE